MYSASTPATDTATPGHNPYHLFTPTHGYARPRIATHLRYKQTWLNCSWWFSCWEMFLPRGVVGYLFTMVYSRLLRVKSGVCYCGELLVRFSLKVEWIPPLPLVSTRWAPIDCKVRRRSTQQWLPTRHRGKAPDDDRGRLSHQQSEIDRRLLFLRFCFRVHDRWRIKLPHRLTDKWTRIKSR